jgi:uncharacterized protein YbbC (DUF1343 family)
MNSMLKLVKKNVFSQFWLFQKYFSTYCLLFCLVYSLKILTAEIQLGVEQLFSSPSYAALLKGHQIGLITNHTAINQQGESTVEILKKNAVSHGYVLRALFAPEHGLNGLQYEGENVNSEMQGELPIYSLHGVTRRPSAEMLKDLSLLIYDIQDIGSRSYTYISTLFYVMEEASKVGIPVFVLDRPNPLGGILVDGPRLEEKWRSFVGYINVPYCHGLTIGELASYFNGEYKVGCALTVIPMQGWKREMNFEKTGLTWIPTSPHIPEARTAFYYPTTGILGELQIVSIGIGYTLPFKVIGAPWIDAICFAEQMNAQNLPGVRFQPFHYRPFFGRFSKETCHGIYIVITDLSVYLPVTTQYILMGILKSLYPTAFQEALQVATSREEMFNKINGTAEVYRLLKTEKYPAWKLRALLQKGKNAYLNRRKIYLIEDYGK